MSLRACYWKAPFSTWSETSFGHIRDSNQPPPPGVDFVNTSPMPYQQHNVSTRLPIQYMPHTTTYTSQQSYTSCTNYSTIPLRNNETTNDQMSLDSSYVTFQPEFLSSLPSSSERKYYPKSKKLRRKEKKKKVVVGLKNQSTNYAVKKKKHVSDHKEETFRKFYQEKTSAELMSAEVVEQERCDDYSLSLERQPPKNGKSMCISMILPLEIFVIIVEYSTAETTLALTFTCQKWNNWLTDEKSVYIDRAWRKSRKNTYPYSRKPKPGIREMTYTIQKINPKPEWYLECDMCYKKSNIMKWKFENNIVKTCYSCKKMYEVPEQE